MDQHEYPPGITLGEAISLKDFMRAEEGVCWVCNHYLCACCGQCHTGDCPESDDECERRI